jgi:DNA-directed RNA polymerase specialized sigma24 family protein
LNSEEVSEVLQRYQSGESANALARAFGVHRRTIMEHLSAGQVETRYRADVDVTEARQLYERGWSLARVGEHFGVAAGTIRRALLEAGTPTRPVGTNQWMRPSASTRDVSG